MHDPSKRCGDCFFWTSADGKTGVCAVLREDDNTPFTPPASGYCTEHRVSTKSADRLKRQVLELQEAIAKLETTVIQKDAYIAGQKESVIYLGREISLRDRRIAELETLYRNALEQCKGFTRTILEQRQRIAELESALQPYIAEAAKFDDDAPDNTPLASGPAYPGDDVASFNLGSHRRAARLLSESSATKKGEDPFARSAEEIAAAAEFFADAPVGVLIAPALTSSAPSELPPLIIEGFKTGRPNPGQWIAAREPIKLQVVCNAIDNVFEVAHPGPFGLLSATEKLADLRTAVESELAYLWRDYALAEDGSLTDAARTLKGELLAAFRKADS